MIGRRNEPARSRRRNRIKKALSLTSVPKSEEDSAGALNTPTWTLNNHFGWSVLQKSQIGDGVFPHLFHFYEKPDLHGRDFDKVTYVLYMDKGTVVDKKLSIKETQTAVSGILITKKPSTPVDYYDSTHVEQHEREIQPERSKEFSVQEHRVYDYTPERRKKKKLISEFYKRDRSRSRSPGDRNKSGHYDSDGHSDSQWPNPTPEVSRTHLSQLDDKVSELERNAMGNKDKTALIWKEIRDEKNNAINNAKKDYNSGINQLRAGAEKVERAYKERYVKAPPLVDKKSSKVMEYIKFKPNQNKVVEELLKTSSGTNQYLFVSGKKRLR